MGHKYFRVRLRGSSVTQVFPFGTRINMGNGNSFTVHTCTKKILRCDRCDHYIFKGDAYIFWNCVRFPEAGNKPVYGRECMACETIYGSYNGHEDLEVFTKRK